MSTKESFDFLISSLGISDSVMTGFLRLGVCWYPKLTMYTRTPIALIKVIATPQIKSTKLSINQNTFLGRGCWAPTNQRKWPEIHS